MDNQHLFEQISQLPDKAKEEVLLFLEFLVNKYQINSTQNNKKRSGFGTWPGIQTAEDFDAELEDFKDYMPE
jgi:hypothetical protein